MGKSWNCSGSKNTWDTHPLAENSDIYTEGKMPESYWRNAEEGEKE